MGFSFIKKLFGATDETSDTAKNGKASFANSIPEPKIVNEDNEAADSKEAMSISINTLENFVLFVVKSLVDSPDEVSVNTVEKSRMSVVQVRCAKKDIGKIIGKSGKTIAALRALVSGAAGRLGLRVTIDVLD